MESIIKKIDRPVMINGSFVLMSTLLSVLEEGQEVTLVFPADDTVVKEKVVDLKSPWKMGSTYIIQVRSYMTKMSTPEFDFHAKFNNNIPMPFRVMQATAIEETRGMIKMDCVAVPLQTSVCSRCGRVLTNPISKLYGIGPECGHHAYINPFETEEELQEHLEEIRDNLSLITWTGWVVKSSIEKSKEVNING